MGINKNPYLLYCVPGNQERKRGLKTLLQPPFGLELELLTVNDLLLPKYSCYFSKKNLSKGHLNIQLGEKKKSTLTSNLYHIQKSIPDGPQS